VCRTTTLGSLIIKMQFNMQKFAHLVPKLQLRWNTLMSDLKVQDDKSSKWYTTMSTRYTEQWRHYHTLQHINELFLYYDTFQHKIQKQEDVQLAIWFHDLVYEPTKNNNEEESARLFNEFCQDATINSDINNNVFHYIMATKSHKALPADKDLLYFLDFDMAILGKSWEEYSLYAAQIRQEYIHFSEKDYCKGRTKVLISLKSGGIYMTEEFKLEYEEKAKQNMEKEISEIQSKL